MTLVELLVAFMVLLMLVGALVALTTRSLETWTTGETRKEMYDRAQVVLDSIVRDLRNTYSENEVYDDGRKEMQVPIFVCDVDRAKQPRLRFVRSGNPYVVGGATVQAQRPRTLLPVMTYGEPWEVAYVMDPDPTKGVLYRGVRSFDRQVGNNLLTASALETPGTSPLFKPVETGILHVGFRFWTQWTTTWDEGAPIVKTTATSRQPSGPETLWDSSRRIEKKFKFHRRQFDRTNPDFVYPEIVQITVHVESGTADSTGVKLAETIDDRSSTIRLTHTRGMPDAPALALIEGEWVEYRGKTMGELTEVRRARRGTAAVSHAALTPLRFGETFTTEVRVAAFREAQEP